MAPPKRHDDTQLVGGGTSQEDDEPTRSERSVSVTPSVSVADGFEDSKANHKVVLDPREHSGRHKAVGQAATEVSQGPWRERAFTPRVTLGKDEILHGLEESLRAAQSRPGGMDDNRRALRSEWLPFLRAAVEQAGGDSLDAYLQQAFGGRPRTATERWVSELAEVMRGMNRIGKPDQLFAQARVALALVQRALESPKPRALSLKWLEEELEGKLQVDAILSILFAGDLELVQQQSQVAKALETLRAQLRSMPGRQPDGMFANFGRLKTEQRVLEAELKRRGPIG